MRDSSPRRRIPRRVFLYLLVIAALTLRLCARSDADRGAPANGGTTEGAPE
jgi:hypothetical protein